MIGGWKSIIVDGQLMMGGDEQSIIGGQTSIIGVRQTVNNVGTDSQFRGDRQSIQGGTYSQ